MKNLQTPKRYTEATWISTEIVERLSLLVLGASLVLILALYMYLVAHAAYATADRREFAQETTRIEGELAVLEAQYLDLRSEVTLANADVFGLESAEGMAYVTVTSRGEGLTFEVR